MCKAFPKDRRYDPVPGPYAAKTKAAQQGSWVGYGECTVHWSFSSGPILYLHAKPIRRRGRAVSDTRRVLAPESSHMHDVIDTEE